MTSSQGRLDRLRISECLKRVTQAQDDIKEVGRTLMELYAESTSLEQGKEPKSVMILPGQEASQAQALTAASADRGWSSGNKITEAKFDTQNSNASLPPSKFGTQTSVQPSQFDTAKLQQAKFDTQTSQANTVVEPERASPSKQVLIDQAIGDRDDEDEEETFEDDDDNTSTSPPPGSPDLKRRTSCGNIKETDDQKRSDTERSDNGYNHHTHGRPQVELVKCWRCIKIPIIHPESSYLLGWNMLGFAFVVFEAFWIPFCMAFDYKPSLTWWLVLSIIDAYFIVDVIIQFMTGFRDPSTGRLEKKPGKIASRYARSTLSLDVFIAIPWEWIPLDRVNQRLRSGLPLMKGARILRCMRLIRLLNRSQLLPDRLAIFMEGTPICVFASGVLKNIGMLFGVTHWCACGFFVIGKYHDVLEDTWVSKHLDGIIDPLEQYVYSLYFSLTTMTTVGYGDITPCNYEEVVFVLILLVVSSVVFATLMGALTSLITNLNSEAQALTEQKLKLSRYFQWRSVSGHSSIFKMVRHHMLEMWQNNEDEFGVYEKELMDQLPRVLRKELCYHIYGCVLTSAPFLAWVRGFPACMKDMANMVSSMITYKGDYLFRMGEPNVDIHMLLSGAVYMTRNQRVAGGMATGEDSDEGADDSEEEEPVEKSAGMMAVGILAKSPVLDIKVKSKASANPADQAKKSKGDLRHANTMAQMLDPKAFKQAAEILDRNDAMEVWAAKVVQKRWRAKQARKRAARRTRRMLTHTGSNLEAPTSAPKGKANFRARTVDAPAYFGESCLWVPFEQWSLDDAPEYLYNTLCYERCEIVCIPREVVKEVIKQYSPWLQDRFETFRMEVIKAMCPDHEKEPEMAAEELQSGTPVDWVIADDVLPNDDASLNSFHCKVLLRSAASPGQATKAKATASPCNWLSPSANMRKLNSELWSPRNLPDRKGPARRDHNSHATPDQRVSKSPYYQYCGGKELNDPLLGRH